MTKRDKFIKTASVSTIAEFHEYMAFIRNEWWCSDISWHVDGNRYEIATCGWSDNEEIIGLMHKNTIFWMLYWQQSTRGGHYVFEPMTGMTEATHD